MSTKKRLPYPCKKCFVPLSKVYGSQETIIHSNHYLVVVFSYRLGLDFVLIISCLLLCVSWPRVMSLPSVSFNLIQPLPKKGINLAPTLNMGSNTNLTLLKQMQLTTRFLSNPTTQSMFCNRPNPRYCRLWVFPFGLPLKDLKRIC